jgi:hypothetical protein
MPGIHTSPYSGSWYPGEAVELDRLLDERFEQSRARTGPYLFPDGLGFVTPHAGPAWSGTVAGAVYRSLRQQPPERVVLLAFPHRGGMGGVASPDVDAITTPFGEVIIDRTFAGGFPAIAESRVCDHSFEIQLPFLQKAVPRARVNPLYVGRMDAPQRAAVAARLAEAWRPGTVFLASSDFNHYGPSFGFVPFPPDSAVAGRLRELDGECMDAGGSLDSALFLETLRERRSTVCGSGPIALLLDVMARLGQAEIGAEIYQETLDYQTSGEIGGDYRDSVSYAALGYFRRPAFALNAGDRKALLDSAARSLRRLRETGVRDPIAVRGGSAALGARRGVFVSLHLGGQLLGCLGSPFAEDPLGEEVGRLALAAALDDPRFRHDAAVPADVEIEISVLTPMRRVRAASQVRVGTHGVLLKKGAHCGLLLPQVAAERDWTAEEFLKALCRKALVGPEDWRHPEARLYVFESQVCR